MGAPVRILSDMLRIRGLKLATAESCTGGMIAAAITDIGGSSDVFDRGFVTYSNQSKMDMLGVKQETLDQFGAVSEQTASEMTSGAIRHSAADCAIAVTGIAGPSGGTAEKPVGLVFIGVGLKGEKPLVTCHNFGGDRTSVRKQTAITAMENLMALLTKV